MIRVTVDLIPFGIASKKKQLGTMDIINDASGTATRGNYKIKLDSDVLKKQTKINGFPRKKKSAFDLVFLAAKALFEKRNS